MSTDGGTSAGARDAGRSAGKTALVLGGSGFIGSFLLQELLASPDYARVIAVFRKAPRLSHPKLEVLIGDFATLPSLKEKFVGDELFLALGTTRASTPDPQEYYRIDHDYPVLAAKLAKEAGAGRVLVVTAVGADVNSRAGYTRMKGEVERDLIALGFKHTLLFRPSMLLGSREEHRSMEKALIGVWSVINPVFAATASRFTGIDGRDVARAMVAAAGAVSGEGAGVRTYHWKEMNALILRRG